MDITAMSFRRDKPLAAQGVGEKAKKVEQMQVLKTDGKVLRITVDGKEQQIPWVINPSLRSRCI